MAAPSAGPAATAPPPRSADRCNPRSFESRRWSVAVPAFSCQARRIAVAAVVPAVAAAVAVVESVVDALVAVLSSSLLNIKGYGAIPTEHSSSELMVFGTNVYRVDSHFLHPTMHT